MGFWWAGNGKKCYCYRPLSVFKLILLKTYRLVFFNQCLAWSFNSPEWLLDWTKACQFLGILLGRNWGKVLFLRYFFQYPIFMNNSANTQRSLPKISLPAISSFVRIFLPCKSVLFCVQPIISAHFGWKDRGPTSHLDLF